jgi:hypothetical protein
VVAWPGMARIPMTDTTGLSRDPSLRWLGRAERVLACFWVAYGLIGVLLFGSSGDWQLASLTVPQWCTLALLICLTSSALLVTISRSLWARRVEVASVGLVLPVAADILLFCIWRSQRGSVFWVSLGTASLALLTLAASLAARRWGGNPPVDGCPGRSGAVVDQPGPSRKDPNEITAPAPSPNPTDQSRPPKI